jgi:hypothetical protein
MFQCEADRVKPQISVSPIFKGFTICGPIVANVFRKRKYIIFLTETMIVEQLSWVADSIESLEYVVHGDSDKRNIQCWGG